MSAMDLKLSTQYDAPPTEVFAMMSDPAFREASCRASHAVSYDVTVTESGGDVVVRVADRPVVNTRQLLNAVAGLKPRETAVIGVQRGDRNLELTVTVAQRPAAVRNPRNGQ